MKQKDPKPSIKFMNRTRRIPLPNLANGASKSEVEE